MSEVRAHYHTLPNCNHLVFTLLGKGLGMSDSTHFIGECPFACMGVCPKRIVSFARSELYHLTEGIVSFARKNCIICQKELYHLPEGIVPCARSELYHLPEANCIICQKRIVSFARSELYHLPEGIVSFARWNCIICQKRIASFARRNCIIC